MAVVLFLISRSNDDDGDDDDDDDDDCLPLFSPFKNLSGEKHKSWTMRPNGALGGVNTCLYS